MIRRYTRVKKTVTEPGDFHPEGSIGTVVSVIEHDAVIYGQRIKAGYFVVWDDFPVPVFVCDFKIAPLD